METPYQVMPELSSEEYESLKANIAENGILVAVEYDDEGNILDGYHRVKAWEELKAEGKDVADYPRTVRSGRTEEEKRTHARTVNMARRHLNREQKQALIRDQLIDTPQKSDRQIAVALGVHHTSVGSVRKDLESIGEISQSPRETTDGRLYPAARQQATNQSTEAAPTANYEESKSGRRAVIAREDLRVNLKEAAQRLGVVEATVRRRIRKGLLKATRESTPQGLLWMVELPADVADVEVGQDGNGGVRAVVESLRAELADYRDQLMAKDRQLGNKDQQIQQLQMMLNEAQAPSLRETRLALFDEAGAALTAPGKSWWRRLLGR